MNTDRPIFPPWMRRLDPLLAAEDTNSVFEMYIRGARRHRKRRFRWQPTVLWLLGLVPFALFVVAFMNLFSHVPVFGMVFVVLSAVMISEYWIRAMLRPPLAESIRSVALSKEGLPRLRELWMTGIKGSEIMEAVYLEGAYRSKRRAVALSAIFPVAVVGVAAWVVGIRGVLLYSLLTSAILFATQFVPSVLVGLMREDAEMSQILRAWAPAGSRMARGPADGESGGAAVVVVIVTCAVIFVGWRLMTFGIVHLAVGVCVGLVLGAIALWATRQASIRRNQESVRRIIQKSDGVFENYMRRLTEEQQT